MVKLEEALFYSKEIISHGDCYSGICFRDYSKSFIGTSENIKEYLKQGRFKRDKALTVLGGGDHVFNLAYMDVKEIDAFDINKLEYFVYYLRKAMIECLSYEEFIYVNIRFDNWRLEDLKRMIEKSKRSLSDDVYEYYRKILEYSKKSGRLENLYYMIIGDFWKKYNLYLKDEESYLLLREKLKEVKVNLYFGDARVVPDILDGSYDIILLSNIADYFGRREKPLTLEEFKEFIRLYYKLLSDKGLLINFLYNIDKDFVIKNSIITKEDLGLNNIVKIAGVDNQGYLRVRKIA